MASTTTNNTDFVKQVYVDLLHRAAELQGYTYWTDLLNRGVLTRLQFVLFVERSTEYRTDVVEAMYQKILRRSPDASYTGSINDRNSRIHALLGNRNEQTYSAPAL